MPRIIVYLWPISFAAIVAAISVISYFNEIYAFDIIRSFVNGETSIGFWMKHGFTFVGATGIAISCSTYDIFTWFYLFNSIRGGFNKMDHWLINFFRNHIKTVAENDKWVKRLWVGAEKLYRFCVPQPSNIIRGCKIGAVKNKISYYCPLAFYGFCPGYVWTGIGYSIAFRLNQSISFVVLSFFNSLKMVIAGYLTIKIGLWGVFAVVILMPFTKVGIEKLLKFLQGK